MDHPAVLGFPSLHNQRFPDDARNNGICSELQDGRPGCLLIDPFDSLRAGSDIEHSDHPPRRARARPVSIANLRSSTPPPIVMSRTPLLSSRAGAASGARGDVSRDPGSREPLWWPGAKIPRHRSATPSPHGLGMTGRGGLLFSRLWLGMTERGRDMTAVLTGGRGPFPRFGRGVTAPHQPAAIRPDVRVA